MSDSVTPRTAEHQASMSSTISRSLLKFMSVKSVMLSNHLIFCHPFLILPSVFPSIRVFSSELARHIRWPKCWSFSFSISPSNKHLELISFRTDWFDLLEALGFNFSNSALIYPFVSCFQNVLQSFPLFLSLSLWDYILSF